jgi:hypothetical protein
MCVGQMCVGQMCVGQMCVGQMCVGQMCVDESVFDEKTWNSLELWMILVSNLNKPTSTTTIKTFSSSMRVERNKLECFCDKFFSG